MHLEFSLNYSYALPANMSQLPIRLLLVLFLLFAFSRVVLRRKEGAISLGSFLFWAGVWSLAAVGIIRPDFTTYIAQSIGIGRGADVVIYLSILIIFYLLFRTHIMIENLHHEITQIIREIALKDARKKTS